MTSVPPLGMCFQVELVRTRDGDTAVVRLRTGQEVAVRLMEIDAPERNEEGGREANDQLYSILEAAEDLRLFIPPPPVGTTGQLEVVDLLKALSFDRIPGKLFADSVDVGEELVRLGAAKRVE